ncbi:MAG: hypothetical protein K6A67_07015 [Bacteroidales bacterium]|nr:hypothetical protein [Bacteroidales bacterium]
MKRPFNKKRFWLIIAILALVEAAIFCLALQWKYIFPSREVSELYTRYENVDGVEVSFIKDYKVNDTVFVDVTLLEATDSVGWVTLKKDFDIVDITPELQQFIDNGENMIFTKLIPKSSFSDTTSCPYKDDLLAISFLTKTLTVFHIKNKEELNAVRHYNYDKSTNQ